MFNARATENTLVVKGKATFRPRGSREDAIPGMAQAFEMMDVQLVPFVFAFHNGWWAQTPLKPERDGRFQSSVYIGRPGTIDVGKDYQIITCVVSRRFNAWNKSLDNLPPVRRDTPRWQAARLGQPSIVPGLRASRLGDWCDRFERLRS